MKDCKDQVREEMMSERVECKDDCGQWGWPWHKDSGPQDLTTGASGANPSASECEERAGKSWSGDSSTEGMRWHEKFIHHFKNFGRKIKEFFRGVRIGLQ